MGLEGNPFLGYIAKLCKGENLKPAAVGKNRLIPIKELVDTAKLINNVLAGANVQMVGVGKLHLTADML